jgi:hypothetical protein
MGGELGLCRQPGPGQDRADVVADRSDKLRIQRVRVVVAQTRVKVITYLVTALLTSMVRSCLCRATD